MLISFKKPTPVLFSPKIFFANFIIKIDDIKKIISFTFFSGLIISIYGLLQIFELDPISHSIMVHDYKNRAFVTMGNPMFVGSYAVILLSISFILYLFKKSH